MFNIHKYITTISDIKKQYKDGALFTCKYKLIITPPLYANYNNIMEKFVILAKTAKLPEHKINTTEIKIKGRPVAMRGQLDMGNTYSITVYEDDNMRVRKVLDRWLDMCDRLDGTGNSSYSNGSIKIYQLDGDNNEMYGIEFYDVFLNSISEVSYDGTNSGEVLSYNLTFSYSGWETI